MNKFRLYLKCGVGEQGLPGLWGLWGFVLDMTTLANCWHDASHHPTAAGYYCSWQTVIARDSGGFDGHVPRAWWGGVLSPAPIHGLPIQQKILEHGSHARDDYINLQIGPGHLLPISPSLLYLRPPPCVGYSPATSMRPCLLIILPPQLAPRYDD